MEKKKKPNKEIVFRLYIALIIWSVIFFPLIFIPLKLQYRIFWPIFTKMFLYAVKVRVHNLSKIDINKYRGVIFASNHKTFADTYFIMNFLRTPFTILYRKGIIKNLFIRFMFWRAGLIPIEKTDAILSINAFKKIKKKLENKFSIIFFPEGWYTTDRPVGEIKKGIALIAKETNCKVIPIAIYADKPDFLFEDKLEWKNFYINAGEPLSYSEFNDRDSFLNEIKVRIEKLYNEIEEHIKK
ncbi:MAG TPA: lysophospholipid acyltransferase family protein [Spirochaetota bacterium]|nr:lysophospholipid acyltransferase family protein [Spirochaetota bacterium]HOL56238.1 lysophospholipid acyltransferase family protein [Spirochaetota bacterium]HPP04145.1 lysophospholipid acyltransferase family protein [Spirochaetota bacterium]